MTSGHRGWYPVGGLVACLAIATPAHGVPNEAATPEDDARAHERPRRLAVFDRVSGRAAAGIGVGWRSDDTGRGPAEPYGTASFALGYPFVEADREGDIPRRFVLGVQGNVGTFANEAPAAYGGGPFFEHSFEGARTRFGVAIDVVSLRGDSDGRQLGYGGSGWLGYDFDLRPHLALGVAARGAMIVAAPSADAPRDDLQSLVFEISLAFR